MERYISALFQKVCNTKYGMHFTKSNNSEVDAYSFIKDQLILLDWQVKNPARFDDGEVYKQNECLSNIELKKSLVRDMPEAVVIVGTNKYWVIESKRNNSETDLNRAFEELSKQYAPKINSNKNIETRLISAIAGNETDGYRVANYFLKDKIWMEIKKNGEPKSSLLSKEEVNYILNNDSPNIDDKIEFSEKKYLTTAEKINETLHINAINKSKRARFIAGLILTFLNNKEIDFNVESTIDLVENINTAIRRVLRDVGKEDFISFIELQIPPSQDNHIKYKRAIIQTYNELKSLDIRSAMNSGNDVLGKFYEVFLKYGNGAKEIGIVLTPRHITKFVADVLDIKHNDIIFDPTCGTGGFLVASYDYVKQNSTEDQLDKFKRYNIFGVEQEDEVVALALVNMIFRGDGRNNIKEGNCFNNFLRRRVVNTNQVSAEFYTPKNNLEARNVDDRVINKVMMNPPFALKSSDDKETKFIDYALEQMDDGGLLFVIVPISVMVEGSSKDWRKNVLLKNNTLLSVITFPEDLFYPVSVGTVGVFVKKGISHDYSKNIFFARLINDGFVKKKGKKLFDSSAKNDLPIIQKELKMFIHTGVKPKDKPQFKQVTKLNVDDKLVELVPEAYLESSIPDPEEIRNGIDKMIRETVSYIIRTKD